ncbi:MAG: ATP-binding protein [Endozoicomonas sp.]
MQFSIRKKIIFFTVVPVTLLYNLLFGVHLYYSLRQSSNEVAKRLVEQVWHSAEKIGSHIQLVMNMTSLMAVMFGEIDKSDQQEISPYLQGFLERDILLRGASYAQLDSNHQTWRILRAYRLDGVILIDEMEERELFPVQFLWANHDSSNNGIWTSPRGSARDGWLISYIVPVKSKNGLQGYFWVDVDLSDLRHTLLGLTAESASFSIVNSAGEYLQTDSETPKKHELHTIHQSQFYYGSPGLWRDLEDLIARGEPAFRNKWVPARQHEYWLMGAPIKPVSWWMTSYAPKKVVLASVIDQAQINAFLMMLSLALIFTCSSLVSVRITRPIIRLKRSMDDFTFRQIRPAINRFSQDEIGSLTKSFQQLADRLCDREKALHQARTNNIGHLLGKVKGKYFYFNLNKDGYVTHVSPSILAILGYSQKAFLKPLMGFLEGQYSKFRFREQFQEVMAGLGDHAFELDVRHIDGSVRQLEIYWSDMGDLPGRQYQIEGLAHDVTDRVSDTRKFKLLLDSAPDATVIATPEGIISMVNSKVELLFGYHREDLVNMPLELMTPVNRRLDHPLLGDLAKASWDTLCLEGYESEAVDKQGRVFPVEITSNPLRMDDGLLISMVIRDITDQKRIKDELLRAKEEAERADLAKGLFLSNMSHELRTPLNGVLGNAQLLLRNPCLTSAQRKSLHTIETSGQHLLSLINDILDLTKIESSQIELHMSAIYLMDLLKGVQSILMERANSKGIDLRLIVSDSIPSIVMLDEIKLRQVLLNLISNGVKYTLNGWVECCVTVHEERLLFEVCDTGVGIAASDQDAVFEPFRQMHTKYQIGGTGLGLSISRRLVIAMGGRLELSSEPGKGSRFTFTLPLVVNKQEELKEKLPKNQALCIQLSREFQGTKVLVVDDVTSNREMLEALLVSVGFAVSSVGNGKEAIDIVQKISFSLIMMDIEMPLLGGIEAMKQIRKLPCGSHLKIIAVTTSVSEGARAQLLSYGFDEYISKPIDATLMFEEIRKLMKVEYVFDEVIAESVSESWDEEAVLNQLKRNYDFSEKMISLFEQGDLEQLKQCLQSCKHDKSMLYIVEYILSLISEMDIARMEQFFARLSGEVNDPKEVDC